MEKVARRIGARPTQTVRATVGQAQLREQFPPRPRRTDWPATRREAGEVMRILDAANFYCTGRLARRERSRGTDALLTWLAEQPGETWQERWIATGVEQAPGQGWARAALDWYAAQGEGESRLPSRLNHGLMLLVCLDVIRPDLTWLLTQKVHELTRTMEKARDPEGFARLNAALQERKVAQFTYSSVRHKVMRMLAVHGGTIADITPGDCVQVLDTRPNKRSTGDDSLIYDILREIGVIGSDAPPTIRVFGTASGQLTVEEMVDRRGIANQDVRDLLIEYLKERQPSLDHSSLIDAVYILAKLFWADLEAHHPGIDSLHLPADVANAWKERLRNTTKKVRGEDGEVREITVPRKGYVGILIKVRAFYLDIAQWAIEDPARWGRWAVPCPIRAADCERAKQRRQHKSVMDQRTRERIPVLPRLVAHAEQHRDDCAVRLREAEATAHDALFTAAGQKLRRVVRRTEGGIRVWAKDPDNGALRDLTREEDEAFWTWAVIEVLRHTGIRVEELLELTHHGIVQYRLPSTGELVPLLQITPSKTDQERLLLISPELADVLAAIVARVSVKDGAIPLVPSYDDLERIWRPPLPLLLQHRVHSEYRPINRPVVNRLINDALARLGETTPDGDPIRFQPHDFRRIFITDAVLNGLPPHIAQIIVGHSDINTTMGYKAIYPTEAIEAHRAFLARRRSLRPSEEYRTPTEEEWEEFLGQFERRKVSIGTCGRAYGTSCQHEHACIRCPMLRPDPGQRPRLVEFRDNIVARIAEAETEHWLGELEGLEISRTAAEEKLVQVDRILRRRTVMLGMPTFSGTAGRVITTQPPLPSGGAR
jgi:integrase